MIAVVGFDQGGRELAALRYDPEDMKNALDWVYNLSLSSPFAGNIASVNLSVGLVGDWYDTAPQGAPDGILDRQHWDYPLLHASSVEECDSIDAADSILESIYNLRNRGIAVVAASGNLPLKDDGVGPSTGLGWPACLDGVISVAATTNQGGLFYYAETGIGSVAPLSTSDLELTFGAPGEGLVVADPKGKENDPAQPDVVWNDPKIPGLDSAVWGSSFSAPQVAGAFALLKEIRPTETVDYLQGYLEKEANRLTESLWGIEVKKIRVDQSLTLAETEGDVFTSNPVLTEKKMFRWCNAHFEKDCEANPGDYLPEYCKDTNGDGVGEVISRPRPCFCNCVASQYAAVAMADACRDYSYTSSECEVPKTLAYGTCALRSSSTCPTCFTERGKKKKALEGLCGPDYWIMGEVFVESIALFLDCGTSCLEGSIGGCGDTVGCATFPCQGASNCGETIQCSTVPVSSQMLRGAGGLIALTGLISPAIILLAWRRRFIKRHGLRNRRRTCSFVEAEASRSDKRK